MQVWRDQSNNLPKFEIYYLYEVGKCQVIVTDDLMLGHPCGVRACRNPLLNNQDRYCAVHYQQHGLCAVSGCEELVVDGRKACRLPEHQRIESLRFQKGKAAFTTQGTTSASPCFSSQYGYCCSNTSRGAWVIHWHKLRYKRPESFRLEGPAKRIDTAELHLPHTFIKEQRLGTGRIKRRHNNTQRR